MGIKNTDLMVLLTFKIAKLLGLLQVLKQHIMNTHLCFVYFSEINKNKILYYF